jgi:uncharacterized protein YjdB/lysophospholipase L1-like esterase
MGVILIGFHTFFRRRMRITNLFWGVVASGAIIASGGCKEATAPVPVVSLSVSAPALNLVPTETARLTAVPRDAAGNPLASAVTWVSSAPSVATVQDGLVTAVSAGTATITASSEGKSATANVSVEDGGLLMPAGGMISAAGGNVQLSVPAAAVVSTSQLFVRIPTNYPPSARLVHGSVFELTSNPAVPGFAQTALLTIRYDPGELGSAPPDGLVLYRAVGDTWQPLDDSQVNGAAHTVSGRVSGVGVYAILVRASVVALEISPASAEMRVRDVKAFSGTVRDVDGAIVSGRAVTWTSTAPNIVQVDAATGQATAVSPGTADVVATSEGVSARASVTVTAGAPGKIRLGDGDGQSAAPGTTLPIAPSVIVTDQDGFAAAGATVTFSVTQGGGSITGAVAVTDAGGTARVGSWTLGPQAGPNTLSAATPGAEGSPVIISATAVQAPPPPPPALPATTIAIFAGDGQTAAPLTAVAIPPAVKITDATGQPVAGKTVVFSVRSGGGTITGATATSDANGIATIGSWVLGTGGGNSLFATATGLSGSPVIFIGTAGAAGPPPPPPPPPSGPATTIAIFAGDNQVGQAFTPVTVRPAVKVTDANGIPVPGQLVVFSIRSGGGTLTGENATSDNFGIATVGSWSLGAGGGNSLFATASGLAGSPLVFVATTFTQLSAAVRIVTFGDSNTDFGWPGTSPTGGIASYVSSGSPRMDPGAGNSSLQLAGKIENQWGALSAKSITAVNHGVSATSSGAGRTGAGAPDAREQVGGVTRFEGEALGVAYPWSGGEPTNANFPSGPVARVRAFVPAANDFVYVSMGTNDPGVGLTAAGTSANLEWMIDRWVNAGHAANHFILTTLPPRDGFPVEIPAINNAIRALAAKRSVRLVDLTLRTSDDNGASWRDRAADTIDGTHYTEAVRDWLAGQVVSYMLTLVP